MIIRNRFPFHSRKVFGLFLWCAACFSISIPSLQAQAVHYRVTLDAVGTTGEAVPFWLAANKYGTVDPQGTNAITRLAFERPFSKQQRWDYSAGVDLVGRASTDETLYIHQLYAGLRYRALHLTVGRREERAGMVDSSLSIGSMTWSGNATPVPKISIAVPDFTSVPGTGGFLAFKGYLAHGWFEADRFVESPFLHEKYLFLRFMVSEDFPARGYAGLVHNATWGGTHPTLGALPQDLDAFIDVFTAQNTFSSRGTPTLGNTVATYEAGLTIHTASITGLLYRQFYLEDRPAALNFRNPWDGLWGVSLKFNDAPRLLSGLLWEHVNTKRQGAKRSEGEPNGVDNYYFNEVYRNGWTYHGRTIGIPLLAGDGHRPGITNNIVIAHHVGLEGALSRRIAYKAFFTYSRNYGAARGCRDADCLTTTSLRTPRTDQYSILFETTGSLLKDRQFDFVVAVAFDVGDLYPENAGAMIGLSWWGRSGR